MENQEAWLSEFAAKLQSRWEAEFGQFKGRIQWITAIQSAIKPLMRKYREGISVFLDQIEGPRLVELVVSGREGFLTDRNNFRAFLGRFGGTTWLFTVYISQGDQFIRIDLSQLLAHWSVPSAQQSPPEIVKFAEYLDQARARRRSLADAQKVPGVPLASGRS
jgi:hypothetical protein